MGWIQALAAVYGIYDSEKKKKDAKKALRGLLPKDALGQEFAQFLLRRLQQNPADSDEFRIGTEAIRDAVGGVAGAQRQRLGQAAATGGFLDSGLVGQGNLEIDRQELESFASSERDLILGLIDRQTQDIVPYLTGASNEYTSIYGANSDARSRRNAALISLFGNSGSNVTVGPGDYGTSGDGDYDGDSPPDVPA